MERSVHLHPPPSSSTMDSKQSSNMLTPLSAALPPSDDNLAGSGHPVGEIQHVVGLDPVLTNPISVNPVAQQYTATVLTSSAMPISGVGCDHGSQPQCQLCGELGHIVHICSKRFDTSYTGVTTPGPSFPNQNLSVHLSYTGHAPPLLTHPYAPNLSFPPPIPQTPIHNQSPSVNFSYPSSSQPHDQGVMSYPTAGTVTYTGLSTMSCPPMCVFQAGEGSASIPSSTIPGDSFSPHASVHPPAVHLQTSVSQPTGSSQQVPHSPVVPFPSAPTGATNHITNASSSMTHSIPDDDLSVQECF